MKQAMEGPDASEWNQAIVEEVTSIIKNDIWKLINSPNQDQVIGSRMILRNKFDPDGNLIKRKARLVAQGLNQKPGIHYTETFAPVARISSIRLLISLADRYNMKLRQFDVASAYLNGKLEEEIQMEPPRNLGEHNPIRN